MTRLEVAVLGSVVVTLDGEPVKLPRKVLALLAYLAVESRRTHRRSELAGLLWPDASEAKALHNLRQALTILRQVLGLEDNGGPHLRIEREAVGFDRRGDHWLDLDAVTQPRGCPDHPDQRRHCRGDCRERMSLRRGPFLQDLSIPDSEAFEHWVMVRRESAERSMAQVLDRLSDCHLGDGEPAGAIAVLRNRISLDPWDEKAHRALMTALSAEGDETAALRHYALFAARMKDELDIEPEEETVRLYRAIRRRRTHSDGRLPQILVVEDEPATRSLFTAFLRGNGFVVQEAGNAGEMRAALARGSFTAIILDVNLPDGDGFRLVEELRSSSDAGLLFVTKRGNCADRVKGLDVGADDYLVKPVHLPELAARLRSVLRRR